MWRRAAQWSEFHAYAATHRRCPPAVGPLRRARGKSGAFPLAAVERVALTHRRSTIPLSRSHGRPVYLQERPEADKAPHPAHPVQQQVRGPSEGSHLRTADPELSFANRPVRRPPLLGARYRLCRLPPLPPGPRDAVAIQTPAAWSPRWDQHPLLRAPPVSQQLTNKATARGEDCAHPGRSKSALRV